jgi:protein ImuA
MSFSQVMRHDFPEEVPRPGPLAALRERIRQPASHGVLPFGVAAIDRALPGGGLALGAVHEILGIGGDEEDGAAACGFIAGLLARLRRGPVLWCLKRPDLYGPGLLAHGLDPARLVIVTAPRDEDILWAIEEGLRAPGLVAVIGEIGRLPLVAGRRLQLAAERSGITAFLLRRWRNGEEAARERERPSAAVTRWRIAALPARDIDDPRLRQLIGQPRWRVELLRCRGGMRAGWDMEVADATGHVRLSPELADRPAVPVDRKEGRLAAEPLQRRTG